MKHKLGDVSIWFLLYKCGFDVGKYVSFEEQINGKRLSQKERVEQHPVYPTTRNSGYEYGKKVKICNHNEN